ncbi:MAG TPA: chemotaxis protein CheW [Coleofasciculaceae cyanobacterium]|jgi:chemosensory pili system protein ChpA (sensor histidine kinase/response regulator)
MSQDKEREIQLQFLEEAQEYLDTIESVLLELTSNHIEGQKMDAVLRAAHSVKGGAGMMGYQTLSQLAHRLEDSFKVMKAQRNSIEVDDELESLLLNGVDRLRQVLIANRQGTDVDEQWLKNIGNPVFERLHERLGDPVADDAATMLGADDGTNVAALLFETEVEGCLNRLESVLADPQAPCLEEELSIMAQELGGLGEMLQLEAFTQLCESIIQHLEAAPLQVREIASSALTAWRRSQALVLVGQVNSLPTAIDVKYAAASSPTQQVTHPTPTPVTVEPFYAVEEDSSYEVVAADIDLDDATHRVEAYSNTPLSEVTPKALPEETVAPTYLDESAEANRELQTAHATPVEAVEENDIASVFAAAEAEFETTHEQVEAYSHTPLPEVTHEAPEETFVVAKASAPLAREVQTDKSEVTFRNDYSTPSAPASTPRWREEKPRQKSSTQTSETQENTVRIPVRQLDRLNDLFGELTIQRNGLGLHLGRLRNLIETLLRRVGTLEQSNSRLRTAYDTVATQAAGRAVRESLVGLKASSGGGDTGQDESRGRRVAPGAEGEFFTDISDSDFSPTPEAFFLSESSSFNSRFDALEMDRYSDLHLLSMEVMETIVQVQEVTSDIGLSLDDTDQTARELNQTAKQLQTNLTRVRMRPLSELVGRFSRALRDLSLQYGKLVELKVYGKGTLIDRSILEALSDPLMHLVRNAFDHGIEDPATRKTQGKPAQGVIEIKAAHRGNQTIITVSDDGNGINLDKIRRRAEAMGLDAGLLAAASEDELLSLIFEPGFSTADRVTDLSGRGVGMDVVRNNLKSIRGDIRVDTTPGQGTTFTLTVPFTLSVARVLLVESNGMLLAFPTDVIEEMLLLREDLVLTTPGSEVLNWEGEMVPLIRLGAWLKFYCPRRVTTEDGVPTISEPTVLMINQGDQLVGLQVDRCWGEREVAIRQVEGTLPMPPGMSSCTILGDGKVVPLVDTASLLRWVKSFESVTISDSPITWGRSERTPTPYGNTPNFRSHYDAQVSESPGVINHATSCNPPRHLPLGKSATPDDPLSILESHSSYDTILVVDDSINVRRFLALALEKAGYLVEQAKDGQDAVEKLLGGLVVSAVICDIEMPRLDGYGFLARVKSDPTYERLPIAMLTSRSGDKHRQLAMTLGAAAYFSKPYNERELLRTLKQVITENQARKPIPTGIV